MTYALDRIEISSDGAVTRAGRTLGAMTFASIAARMDAVGEHYAEDGIHPDMFGDDDDRTGEVIDRASLALTNTDTPNDAERIKDALAILRGFEE